MNFATAAADRGCGGISRASISPASTIKSDDNGTVSSATGKHRARQKREALQKLANEIRRIVGNPAKLHYADAAMRRASCFGGEHLAQPYSWELFSSVPFPPLRLDRLDTLSPNTTVKS